MRQWLISDELEEKMCTFTFKFCIKFIIAYIRNDIVRYHHVVKNDTALNVLVIILRKLYLIHGGVETAFLRTKYQSLFT